MRPSTLCFSVFVFVHYIEGPLYLSSATRSVAQLWSACLQCHCPSTGSCWWQPLEMVKMSRGAVKCVHYSTHDSFIFTSLFLRDLFLLSWKKKSVVLEKYISELTADAFFVNMTPGCCFCGWRGYEGTTAVTGGPAPTLGPSVLLFMLPRMVMKTVLCWDTVWREIGWIHYNEQNRCHEILFLFPRDDHNSTDFQNGMRFQTKTDPGNIIFISHRH